MRHEVHVIYLPFPTLAPTPLRHPYLYEINVASGQIEVNKGLLP